MNIRKRGAVLFAVLLLASCKTPSVTTGSTSSGLMDELSKNNWQLFSINGSPVDDKTAGNIPFIHFDVQNMMVSGNSGCNTFSGGFQMQGNELSFGNLASTRMACEDMTMETAFLEALGKVKQCKPDQQQLHLQDGQGETLLTFNPKK